MIRETFEKFEWTQEEFLKVFTDPHTSGFIGDKCNGCEKTVNVLNRSVWFCNCGHYNFVTIEDIKNGKHHCHENPEYGPSALQIYSAKEQAKELLESQRWQFFIRNRNDSDNKVCLIHPSNALIVIRGGRDVGKVKCLQCEEIILPTQLLNL